MFAFLISIHVLTCLILVVVVLMQAGKGGGLAGAFGGPGGAGQSFFGGRGAATFLSKATVALGSLFFVTAISLALITASQSTTSNSLIQQEAQQQGTTPLPAPGQPGAPPGQGTPPSAQPAAGTDDTQGSTPAGSGSADEPATPAGEGSPSGP
jgi:preprotein translocase subunit SecG